MRDNVTLLAYEPRRVAAFAVAAALALAALIPSIGSGSVRAGWEASHLGQVPLETRGPVEQGSPQLQLVGQIGGATHALAVRSPYAYVGVGPRLVVLDVSNPADPRPVGQSAPFPDVVQSVALLGDFAFVAAGDAGLRVIDISNPRGPAEIAARPELSTAVSVVVDGGYVYVLTEQFLLIFDVANPREPAQVGGALLPRFSVVGGESSNRIAVRESYAYVAAGKGGLRILDISERRRPVEVGVIRAEYRDSVRQLTGEARSVALDGQYAYVGYGPTQTESYHLLGLGVVDVSVPSAPVAVVSPIRTGTTAGSGPDSPGTVVGVATRAGYLYTLGGRYAGFRSNLFVLDVSDPASPTRVGRMPVGATAIVLEGERAYVAGGGGLRILDVPEPASPVELGGYSAGWGAVDRVAVDGDRAYVVAGDRFRSIDVANPAAPRQLSVLQIGSVLPPGRITVSGGRAYVPSLRETLVVDVSDPERIDVVGRFAVGGSSIEVVWPYAYILGSPISIVDVSDVASAARVGSYALPIMATDLAVRNGYAYVLANSRNAQERGLRIVDVRSPDQPESRGFLPIEGFPAGMTVDGAWAYVWRNTLRLLPGLPADFPGLPADFPGSTGISVIDVSDPDQPKEVAFHATPDRLHGLALRGPRALVLGEAGLRALDVREPTSPTQIASHPIPWGPSPVVFRGGRIAVNGERIFVAVAEGGLLIFRLS